MQRILGRRPGNDKEGEQQQNAYEVNGFLERRTGGGIAAPCPGTSSI
jgi:hypothetical protein